MSIKRLLCLILFNIFDFNIKFEFNDLKIYIKLFFNNKK